MVRQKLARLVVIVGVLAASCAPGDSRPTVEQLNERIAALTLEITRPDAPVIAVDMWTGYDVAVHSADGIHPNEAGEALIAERWTTAIVDQFPVEWQRDGPLRIMPLGDSITEWFTRYELWQQLVESGLPFDLVGSRNSVPMVVESLAATDDTVLAFDRDHEGHAGWAASELVAGAENHPEDGRLDQWIRAHPADIVLLHIGTNDILRFDSDADAITERIRRIVYTVQEANPSVAVFVAQIIPLAVAPDVIALEPE